MTEEILLAVLRKSFYEKVATEDILEAVLESKDKLSTEMLRQIIIELREMGHDGSKLNELLEENNKREGKILHLNLRVEYASLEAALKRSALKEILKSARGKTQVALHYTNPIKDTFCTDYYRVDVENPLLWSQLKTLLGEENVYTTRDTYLPPTESVARNPYGG